MHLLVYFHWEHLTKLGGGACFHISHTLGGWTPQDPSSHTSWTHPLLGLADRGIALVQVEDERTGVTLVMVTITICVWPQAAGGCGQAVRARSEGSGAS